MNHDSYAPEYLKNVLQSAKVIALVGASPNPDRPSHSVMRFLQSRGYRVMPVNPGQAGKEINGETVFATLADVPVPVDLVDVFRASDHLGIVVDEALALANRPKAIWAQLGVRDDAATARAEAAGVNVVMNRCPAIELPRLFGGPGH